jgi:hypothetical protein
MNWGAESLPPHGQPPGSGPRCRVLISCRRRRDHLLIVGLRAESAPRHFCAQAGSCPGNAFAAAVSAGVSLRKLSNSSLSVPRWRMRSVHHSYGFEIVADPFSVKRDSSSTSLALARFTDSSVVSTQPDPRFSPVSTLPLCINSSCCCMLACSCLHQATKRPRADVARLPSM